MANTDKLAPYKVAGWADIPDGNKEATGIWTNNYTGFQSIGYDASLGDITKVADLADPKYKGKVALNGDPLKAGAGFNGVVLAALANGGSADNIAPGVDFFKKLTDSGNLIPVDPAPATIASGTTPIVIDWTYNQVPQIAAVTPKGTTWKVVIPSDAPPVGAYYNSAINKDAAHPAAARCWMEYIFSDAGENTWIKGGAMPIRLAAMQKAGTLDKAALAAVNRADHAPGPADRCPDRRSHPVSQGQLEVHLHQVARDLEPSGPSDRSAGSARRAASGANAGPAHAGAGPRRLRGARELRRLRPVPRLRWTLPHRPDPDRGDRRVPHQQGDPPSTTSARCSPTRCSSAPSSSRSSWPSARRSSAPSSAGSSPGPSPEVTRTASCASWSSRHPACSPSSAGSCSPSRSWRPSPATAW